ncbi:MAG: phosphoenolpyruvate synthase [Gammaproteobacteria bacterium]|nr:phosphoenolpyruvate synthase [Gammaproteobacteria bacterium]
MKYVVELSEVGSDDIESVGGKNASLGEMIQHLTKKGINTPNGFATTASAYKDFLSQNHLDKKISYCLASTKINNITQLKKSSAQIKKWILKAPFSPAFESAIISALKNMQAYAVAVRSSATVEDLPEASFAGQQETYLNVKGTKNILHAIKRVFASLYTPRAIAYRHHHKLDHMKFSLSAGVQPMIRSDKGVSGVMFTLDTESGFDQVVLINASYGLGEAIVQGHVNPDEFYLYKLAVEKNKLAILQKKLGDKSHKMVYANDKNSNHMIKTVKVPEKQRRVFCINDHDLHTLAKYALIIEKHYGMPMDIEWAKDGLTGKLYILQARPETVKSQANNQFIEHYQLTKKGKILSEGLSIGQRIASGKVRMILDPKNINQLKTGEVLVTHMTDPDWEPIMKKAAAVVTNQGGRTCHAAIVARELGIPAIVGCGDVTKKLKANKMVTVSCAEGEKGYIYEGSLPFQINKMTVNEMPKLPLKVCVNLGNPDKAFATQFLPNDGVGLARLEFIISNIGIHPNAALNYKKLPPKIQTEMLRKTNSYSNPKKYYLEKLKEGIAKIAAAFYPKEVIFRFSDFKSNEYANLLGGNFFESYEENPMIGFRGASRYRDERFKNCFELECRAFKCVRDEMGLTNANLMIPFVRTVDELKGVIQLMEHYGLKRGANQLKVYMMCEIPSNVILAKTFLKYVDGFSIGSNDLTQLILGLDRDSKIVASLFDERNEAVKNFIHKAISECRRQNKYIGICGQGPSDHPDFAEWLMQEGIESMSLSPDSVIKTRFLLAKKLKSIDKR